MNWTEVLKIIRENLSFQIRKRMSKELYNSSTSTVSRYSSLINNLTKKIVDSKNRSWELNDIFKSVCRGPKDF